MPPPPRRELVSTSWVPGNLGSWWGRGDWGDRSSRSCFQSAHKLRVTTSPSSPVVGVLPHLPALSSSPFWAGSAPAAESCHVEVAPSWGSPHPLMDGCRVSPGDHSDGPSISRALYGFGQAVVGPHLSSALPSALTHSCFLPLPSSGVDPKGLP